MDLAEISNIRWAAINALIELDRGVIGEHTARVLTWFKETAERALAIIRGGRELYPEALPEPWDKVFEQLFGPGPLASAAELEETLRAVESVLAGAGRQNSIVWDIVRAVAAASIDYEIRGLRQLSRA